MPVKAQWRDPEIEVGFTGQMLYTGQPSFVLLVEHHLSTRPLIIFLWLHRYSI